MTLTEKENKQTKEFIKYIQSLNEKQQIGLNVMIQGLMIIAEQKKGGHKNRR